MMYTVLDVKKYAEKFEKEKPKTKKKNTGSLKVPGSIFSALDGGEQFDDDFSLASIDDAGYTTALANTIKSNYFEVYQYVFETYPDIYFEDDYVKAQAIFKNCVLKLSRQFNTVGDLLNYLEFAVLNWDQIQDALNFKGFPAIQFISHEGVVAKIRAYQRYGLPEKKATTATRDRASEKWEDQDMEF